MNKKIISFIIAFILPLTFLVGCKDSSKKSNFVMTEDTKALDGSVEYNANTYKKAFYSTKNYSKEYLQDEFNTFVKEVTTKEDLNELVELLNSYSHAQDGDFEIVKSTYEKYNSQNKNTDNITLNSNALSEISSRLYKATLNATRKYYTINDFYIYYKDQLLNSTSSTNNDEFENEVKIEAIKAYTIANIYKDAYDESFISELILSLEDNSATEAEEKPSTDEKVEVSKEETPVKEDKTGNVEKKPTNNKEEDKNNSTDKTEDKTEDNENNKEDNDEEDNYPEYIELTDVLKSQIAEAGSNYAKNYIAQNIADSPKKYCEEVYNDLENDNPLGDKKNEGFKIFEKAFKDILEQNNIKYDDEQIETEEGVQ